METPSEDAIRFQLARLQASPEFAGSARLLAFLQFVVEEALANGGAGLKEVVIGNAIYERDPPYDTRIDSTVRVEARRLRRKLDDYYSGSGSDDTVLITLPVGSYVPSFSERVPKGDASPSMPPGEEIFRAGRGAAVAIMPFRAIPREAALDVFAEELTDELIFTLGQVEGIWLVSRSAVFQEKYRGLSPSELAAALSVDAVLQGTVRRNVDTLRITVELADVDGLVVWSDRFEVSADLDFGQLQDKIARTLLSRVRLDSSRMRAMKIGPGPEALKSLAKVYRARALLDQQTPDSIANARRLFAQIADAAPDYARGHSGLADCACDLFRLGVLGREQALEEAGRSVEAALAIDPYSVEANAAQATIFAWLERSPPKAQAAFEHARSLGLNARCNRLYGVFLSLFGQHDKAIRLFREARDVEPFSTQQDIAEAISAYQARRFSDLTEAFTPTQIRLQPGEAMVSFALALIFEGKAEIARSLLPAISQQCAESPEYLCADAEIAAWLGDPHAARSLLGNPPRGATCFALAALAAAIGAEDACLGRLEGALNRGELSTAWMRSDARFDRFRASERFQLLLARLSPLQSS